MALGALSGSDAAIVVLSELVPFVFGLFFFSRFLLRQQEAKRFLAQVSARK